MGDFFHGWRRKTGVLTLAIACLLATGWLRSLAFSDEVRFHTVTDRTDGLVSMDSSIGWEERTGFEFHNGQSLSFMEVFPGSGFVDISSSKDPRNSRWDWRWYWCGFASGVAQYGHGLDETHIEKRKIWIVPYWSLVSPLTLLATWLLISNPQQGLRHPLQKRSSEP